MIDEGKINSVVARLKRHNSDYSTAEIRTMADTAVWEKSIDSYAELYYTVLGRILEEKGYVYQGDQFVKMEISSSESLDSHGYYEGIRKQVSNLIQTLLRIAKLSDEELFVLGCIYKIEPVFSGKKISEMFKSLPPYVDSQKMTYKNIGAYIGKDAKAISVTHHGAITKLEKICANSRIFGARSGDSGHNNTFGRS
jgi:hypothetical protein